jgi:asparagine synthase (glutamine-hydrolysing)
MFAIALWDAREQRLVLVRDRFGKKPFVYKHEKDRLIFASELKSLLQVPRLRKEIDPIALDQYLTYQYVPHPRTIYKGFSKLPPGHLAVFDRNGDFQVQSYWNCDFNFEESGRSFADWSEELRALLGDSVKLRLRSDVPLGAFLSGGIDSTIITGLMQKFSTQKVRTFSIGFPQKEYDETSYARAAAQKFGTEHEEFFVTPDAKTILPKLVYHYDEPFSDSSAIPTWYLAEMTKKRVTVALSGDAGDELFAGYERYLAVGLGNRVDLLPLALRRFLAGPVMRLIPSPIHQNSKLRRLKRFLEALGMTPLERYLQWIAIFNRSRKSQLYSGDFRKTLAAQSDYDMLDFLTQAASKSTKRDAITAITLTDLITYLPGDLMCKTDIASMGHALECRAPFLDYRVVEHAIRMPITMKIHGSVGKWILRETFKEFFPPELLRRSKMGFGVPLDHWFRGELAQYIREILLDPQTLARGYFEPDTIRRLILEHQSSQFDHAGRLWSLLFLELWFRQWT